MKTKIINGVEVKVLPNTDNKLNDITEVVEDFWSDKQDVQEATEMEMYDFIIGITAIIDREEKKND